MSTCLMAKKASSDTDLMFQLYLPYISLHLNMVCKPEMGE